MKVQNLGKSQVVEGSVAVTFNIAPEPFAERDCEPSLVAPDSVVQSYPARRQILWTPEQST